MKHIYFFLCFISLSLVSFAQDQQRIEYDLEDAAKSGYQSYSLGSEGVMVVYKPKGKIFGPTSIVKIGIDFKEKKRISLTTPKGYVFNSMTEDAGNIYLLYTPKGEFKKYTIYKFPKDNLKYSSYDGTFVKHLVCNYFKVMNGTVYMGTNAGPNPNIGNVLMCISVPLCFIPMLFYNPKEFPYVAAIDMNKKTPVKRDYIIEQPRSSSTSFLDMSVDDSLNIVDLLFHTDGKKTSKTYVRQIKDQKLDKEYNFKLGSGKEIHAARVFNIDANQKVLFGMFKNKERAKKKKGQQKPSPGGMFISSMINGKQTYCKLVPFSSFKNFKLSIFNENKVKAMSDRKKKRVAKYDDMLQGTIEFSFHNLLVRENEMLVFAEPYYPTYHTETVRTVDAQGRGTTTTITVFDGYKFMGALVMAFDMEGNMKWENGFKIENGPLSFSTAHKFDFYEMEDGGIKVLFGSRNSVFSKIIYNDNVESEKELLKIKSNANDKKVTTYESTKSDLNGIDYWYDNFYLAHGIQKIKSDTKNAKNKKNRSVYYLNKIEIEE